MHDIDQLIRNASRSPKPFDGETALQGLVNFERLRGLLESKLDRNVGDAELYGLRKVTDVRFLLHLTSFSGTGNNNKRSNTYFSHGHENTL